LALTTLGALLIGFAWVAGGRYIEIGPWTVLGWHGILGWAVVVLTVVHMLARRRWRVLRPRRPAPKRAHATGRVISRRGLMATGALAVTGVAIWGVAETLDRLGAQPRRFTGSRWLPNGGIPPPTTFFGEGVPQIDAASWRVRIHGKVDRTVELSLAELEELGLTSEEHVLDCTGGWAMRTVWAGVPMATALHAAAVWPSATTVNVRSVTGWGASLPIDEARGTMLATHVSGQPLPNANGAPCRLIVPNRRGLDWVKWVHEIEVA
jgi:DMSO/TMAO reductase YedYZ molybdopterin-dependent catalytic subunit